MKLTTTIKPLGMTLLFLGLFSSPPNLIRAHDYDARVSQEQALTEVLEDLGETYQVFFSYNADLLANIRVDFSYQLSESLDQVMHRLLDDTNFAYETYGEKYFVVFEKTKRGIRDAKKLKRNVKRIQKLESRGNLNISPKTGRTINKLKETAEYIQFRTRTKNISGTITTEEGQPVVGATVRAKGTNQGSITDDQGKYELVVDDKVSTLIISYIGYTTQEVEIGGRSIINISMLESNSTLDEVVVVGYGTQRKADITGAIGSVSKELLNNTTYASTGALLQGKVAGVRVETNGGSPGAGVNVVIRGSGTFGNDQPLFVIDGNIVESMNYLNPNDIESVEVLKDASAAAIYGNRASNGVVLVTTKKGQAGDIQINFDSKWGIQTPTNTFDFLNAREYADYRNAANDNDGDPRAVPNDTGFDPSIDTDWQDLSLNPALYQDYNVSISGGNANSTYYLSGQYVDQEGIVVDSDFKRYNIRANSTFRKGIFSMEENLTIIREQNNPNTLFGRERGEIPTIPVYNEDNIGGFAGIDPVLHGVARGINWYGRAILEENLFTTDRVIGNITPQLELLPGLTYKLNLSLDYSVRNNYAFQPVFFLSTSQEASNDIARLSESYTRFVGVLIENTLNYKRSFGGHNIDLLAGYISQKGEARGVGAIGTNFSTNEQRVLSAAIDNTDVSGELQENALLSILGRLNYNYKGKYLLSATVRRDGSSRFAADKRWGTFPSISVGWRISDEDFFPTGVITNLKIRASYGELGSQNIGNYDIISGININNGYNFAGVNSGTSAGSIVRNLANPNLIWETTKTTNVGIDAGILDDKLVITLEYFKKRSEDILTNLPIPLHGGLGASLRSNAATIDNEGFEFGATYKSLSASSDFSYNIGVNVTTLRNEVISLGEGVNPITGGGFSQSGVLATRTDVGYPVGAFYGYVVEGLYQNQEEISADGRTDAVLGDFNYLDLDDDGDIDDDDRTFLGDAIPDLTFGVNFNATYKAFDFGLFIQSVQGVDIWNAKRLQFILDGSGGNKISAVQEAWTPQNTNTDIPRLTVRDRANNRRSSDFYVEDGSYIRVKSLQLGYTFPQGILNVLSLSRVRLYVSGQNIFTLTNYTGFDPEIGRGGIFSNTSIFNGGVDRTAYPQARTWFGGIQVSF